MARATQRNAVRLGDVLIPERSWTEVAREYKKRTGEDLPRGKAWIISKQAEQKLAAAFPALAECRS